MKTTLMGIFTLLLLLASSGCAQPDVNHEKVKTMGQVLGLDLRQEIQETRPEDRTYTEDHLRSIGYVQ